MSNKQTQYLKLVIEAQKWLLKRLFGNQARLMCLCSDLIDGKISKKDALYEHHIIEKSYWRARENFRELAKPGNVVLNGRSLDEMMGEIGLKLPRDPESREEDGSDEADNKC